MHDAFDVMAPMSVMLPPAPPASELPEPEPPAKQCEQCAAVKRLKGGVSIDGLSAWHARPCVHGMNALDNDKTGPQAPPGGVSSLCMRSALKEDLRPRRLFDLGGDSPAFGGNDDELNADEEELGGVFGDECDDNVRRTMSVIDGISRDLQEGDYEGVPSITDSAVLLQLTQGLTLITLGSKRAFDERD
ncbi:hypothetical protein Ctob_007768 [Chrysochromulina tobinii]|uniref:Uncharacterized protein n=1 Tax=Chrysochromulina tobinii TaxID=1460289 RepID=A0A0M0K3A1_9EUKA|nr:hypothetical protein Ctob_007768 [Chrysochromulina tobinii]|eukprot:KOO33295.1 hypothetical protein Ctob_007768 [Chrysochromulina sp. CCMP291]